MALLETHRAGPGEEGVPLERLCEKLKSRRGASILMALLFLLVCMMVASSLLMAAVSNGGKTQGDRTEQQKYLTLSSALRLVCGELARMEYRGQYQHTEWTVVNEQKNDKGEVISITRTDYYWCGQAEGELKGGRLEEALRPFFLAELDGIYGEGFADRGYQALYSPAPAPEEHTMVLTVDGGDLPGLAEPVTVTLWLENGGKRIRLTAALGSPDADGYIYTLEAQMASGGIPAVEYSPPAGAIKGDPSPGTAVFTDAVRWELEWIEKGAAGG